MDISSWQRMLEHELGHLTTTRQRVKDAVSNNTRFMYESKELWLIHVRRTIADYANAVGKLTDIANLKPELS